MKARHDQMSDNDDAKMAETGRPKMWKLECALETGKWLGSLAVSMTAQQCSLTALSSPCQEGSFGAELQIFKG